MQLEAQIQAQALWVSVGPRTPRVPENRMLGMNFDIGTQWASDRLKIDPVTDFV